MAWAWAALVPLALVAADGGCCSSDASCETCGGVTFQRYCSSAPFGLEPGDRCEHECGGTWCPAGPQPRGVSSPAPGPRDAPPPGRPSPAPAWPPRDADVSKWLCAAFLLFASGCDRLPMIGEALGLARKRLLGPTKTC